MFMPIVLSTMLFAFYIDVPLVEGEVFLYHLTLAVIIICCFVTSIVLVGDCGRQCVCCLIALLYVSDVIFGYLLLMSLIFLHTTFSIYLSTKKKAQGCALGL